MDGRSADGGLVCTALDLLHCCLSYNHTVCARGERHPVWTWLQSFFFPSSFKDQVCERVSGVTAIQL